MNAPSTTTSTLNTSSVIGDTSNLSEEWDKDPKLLMKSDFNTFAISSVVGGGERSRVALKDTRNPSSLSDADWKYVLNRRFSMSWTFVMLSKGTRKTYEQESCNMSLKVSSNMEEFAPWNPYKQVYHVRTKRAGCLYLLTNSTLKVVFEVLFA